MGLLGLSMNKIRFGYNNFMIFYTLLVLNSLSFIADGMYTLDNRCPVLPFDYAGRGLAGSDSVEGNYDENGYGFAS